ncbi:MAG: hypothetical protein Q4F81_03305 [Eubacteriales bacterium]|nr:hypothetical protein [Eubacteriales bacterium]
MPIPHYLAMTGAEMAGNFMFPHHTAWMACHFSPSGTGLSNLPKWLPDDSLLILDDSTPMHDHDPEKVAAELGGCMERLPCVGLLLDFQRPDEEQAQKLAEYLCQALPFPVVVSELYADGLDCPVFVSPISPDEAMESRLSRWHGREVWLDTTMEGLEIVLTEKGAASAPLPPWERPDGGLEDKGLHCHYHISLDPDKAVFTLWRTPEDIAAQLDEAESLGVTAAVGLYQEFRPLPGEEEGVD